MLHNNGSCTRKQTHGRRRLRQGRPAALGRAAAAAATVSMLMNVLARARRRGGAEIYGPYARAPARARPAAAEQPTSGRPAGRSGTGAGLMSGARNKAPATAAANVKVPARLASSGRSAHLARQQWPRLAPPTNEPPQAAPRLHTPTGQHSSSRECGHLLSLAAARLVIRIGENCRPAAAA